MRDNPGCSDSVRERRSLEYVFRKRDVSSKRPQKIVDAGGYIIERGAELLRDETAARAG